MTSDRKSYTEEFKREAVRLMETSGQPVAQLARDLGINDNNLYRWRGVYGSGTEGKTTGSVAEMEAELKRNPNTKFLLTTDSTAEKEIISKIFKEKIITADINQGRDSVTAMKDAMMELYALAHMRKIIGSYWSSFTFTAISYLNYLKPYSIVK